MVIEKEGILLDILNREPKIVITRDKVSRKPIVEVEGLWTGRDRLIIATHLRKAIRRKAHEYIKARKQADLLKKEEVLISDEEKSKEEIEKTSELIQEATKKNNKKEGKEKCPKAKTKKKKLLMKKRKR